MFNYINEVIDAFTKVSLKKLGTKSSYAPKDLFTVNEDCPKLDGKRAVAFHNIVAKLLWATKQISTLIALLTTRVQEPDEDDWRKLTHLIEYLIAMKLLPLILSADGTGILEWWVDTSFAVHPNMHGHSGGGLSLGQGFPIITSTKQKLNT
jgi:hypothetical protein